MNDYDEVLTSVRTMTWAGWVAWSNFTDVPLGHLEEPGIQEAARHLLIETDAVALSESFLSLKLTELGATLAKAVLSIAEGQWGATASSLVAVERLDELPTANVRETIVDAARELAAEGWLVTWASGEGVHPWFPYQPTLLCRVVAAWRNSAIVVNFEQLIEGYRLSEAAVMLLRFGADVRTLAVLDQELGSLILSDALREGMAHRLKNLREQAVTLHAILDFFCERSAKLIERMDAPVDPTPKD